MPLGPPVESLSFDPSRRAGIDGWVERLRWRAGWGFGAGSRRTPNLPASGGFAPAFGTRPLRHERAMP